MKLEPLIESFYEKHYKKLFLIPITIVILSLATIMYTYSATGDVMYKDVSLKGGLTVTVYTEKEISDLKGMLEAKFPLIDVETKQLAEFGAEKQIGVIVSASGIDEKELTAEISRIFGMQLTDENYSVEFVGSSLGNTFYKQMLVALLISFLFMAIVVFITFKAPIPSAAVVLSAFTDITVTLAVLDIFHYKISAAGISALLLLIGYSVDTDMLLITKILKRQEEGTAIQMMIESAKTGLTMTAATIAAVTVGYFLSTSEAIQQMFLIIMIAMIIDVFSTYMMNAGLLVWYVRRKKNVH